MKLKRSSTARRGSSLVRRSKSPVSKSAGSEGLRSTEDRAMVKLAVNNTVKLYTDTIASIKTRGIIGEKFLALSPGGGGDPLKPGDTIRDTESGLDLEELVSQYVHGNVK